MPEGDLWGSTGPTGVGKPGVVDPATGALCLSLCGRGSCCAQQESFLQAMLYSSDTHCLSLFVDNDALLLHPALPLPHSAECHPILVQYLRATSGETVRIP